MTYDEIEELALDMRKQLCWNIFRHFKGGLYHVTDVATHTETNEILVIYHPLGDMSHIYAQPLEMFLSDVDKEKYPDAKQEKCFEMTDGEDDE